MGSVVRFDAQQDCPADNTDTEYRGCGNASSLEPIRVGGKEEHEDQSDGVGRDSKELGLPISEARPESLTLASVYPRPLMIVGKNPVTDPRPRFIHVYLPAISYASR